MEISVADIVSKLSARIAQLETDKAFLEAQVDVLQKEYAKTKEEQKSTEVEGE